MTNPARFTVRAATIHDFEPLCALWKWADDLHRDAHPDLVRSSEDLIRKPESLRAILDGAESTILVAEGHEHELLGLATLIVRKVANSPILKDRNWAELENMVVHPAAQRQGVGTALVEAGAEWARGKGLERLELTAYEFNGGALVFYGSLGFAPMSRRMVRRLD